jgi:hypothetical protein
MALREETFDDKNDKLSPNAPRTMEDPGARVE